MCKHVEEVKTIKHDKLSSSLNLCFLVADPGSRVQGPGSRVQGPGSGVLGPGSRVRPGGMEGFVQTWTVQTNTGWNLKILVTRDSQFLHQPGTAKHPPPKWSLDP